MKTRPIISQLLDLLQDETRLAIFIHLLVYKTLTLKQLSEHINKGKTTITALHKLVIPNSMPAEKSR